MGKNPKGLFAVFKKKYLIEPRIQWELVVYLLAFPTLIVGFLYVAVLHVYEYLQLYLDKTAYSYLLHSQFSYLKWIFLSIYLVSMLFTIFGIILISNRLVGPIYRLKKILKETPPGTKLNPIKFRKSDFHQELAQLLNRHFGNED